MEHRKAIAKLGWDSTSWDQGDEQPFNQRWTEMGKERRQAAELVGSSNENFAVPHTGASLPHLTQLTPPRFCRRRTSFAHAVLNSWLPVPNLSEQTPHSGTNSRAWK